jgi:hypothetical protein
MRCFLVFFCTLIFPACLAEPDPLPTQVLVAGANKRIERVQEPPLYQMLYDYAFLPEVQHAEQRVRILIWLRRVGLGDYQLASLKALSEWVVTERERIDNLQHSIVNEYEPKLLPTYSALWEGLQNGMDLDDPALEQAAQSLLVDKLQFSREAELFRVRVQGVTGILDRAREWMRELSPSQEIPFTDALFFLRHRLDPYANPGDFQALIGTIFVAGDWGTLVRGAEGYQPDRDHLNLGGLWSEVALSELEGPIFNDARREIVLYMILLEPALGDAIDAAREARDAASAPPAE